MLPASWLSYRIHNNFTLAKYYSTEHENIDWHNMITYMVTLRLDISLHGECNGGYVSNLVEVLEVWMYGQNPQAVGVVHVLNSRTNMRPERSIGYVAKDGSTCTL